MSSEQQVASSKGLINSQSKRVSALLSTSYVLLQPEVAHGR